MSEHENFKLKREIVQLRKITEAYRVDIKQKDYRIVELEEEADHLRNENQDAVNSMKAMDQRIKELEKVVRSDDTFNKEQLQKEKNQLQNAMEIYEKENKELRYQLEMKDQQLNNLRVTLHEASQKHKDPDLVKDEFHYRDEVQDNREKLRQLVEKNNIMSQAIERLTAENRVVRKMAGVPDDYNFDLDDIIQEGQLQVEKYRAQVRALEEEVEELEEERARLRRIIRGAGGGEVEESEGTKKAMQKERMEFQEKCRQYEEEIAHLKQQMVDGGGGVGMSGSRLPPETLQEMVNQQREFKEQMMDMMRQMQQQTSYGGQQQTGQQQSLISQKQQVNTQGLPQLMLPPTPIPGAFGNYNDIKDGYSQRFNSKLPVDMSAAYGDSGLDQMQLKYELATLQLQNLETLRLLQEKEREYKDLQNEVTTIKEDIKGKGLLVQDELFTQYVKEREQFKQKYEELEQKYKLQQDVVAEAKIKMLKYQDFLSTVQSGDPQSAQNKLAELTKRTAILDVNLIKLSRKYEALLEEFNQMKGSYLICNSEHIEREKELLEKIYAQMKWKKTAEENMKLMLNTLRQSIPFEKFNDIRQKNEYLQDKLANIECKEAEYLKRIAELEGVEREVYEKGERIRALEEEFLEVQLEEEVIKKRLAVLDTNFQKYQEVYAHMIDFIKMKGISPMEMFKQFDENGDGKISRNEFSQAIKNMGIPILSDEMEVVYMFVDLDGSGQIEYHEFLRRLKRSGVNVRKAEDELLFSLYRAIKEAGLTLKEAFNTFDTEGRNVITKKSMQDTLNDMGVKYNQAAIDYIFKMADTSGDQQISFEEFNVLFEDIIKQEMMSQGKEINIALDWKYAVMCKLDGAIKDQRLTLLDVFKMIDRDGDQVVSHNEFQSLFKDMDVGVKPDDVRNLFDQIDADRNGQITYNEMLGYLREAKREEDKFAKLKFIQERTNELKQQQDNDKSLKQMQAQGPTMTTESRQAMKISILEMREKNANQRAQLLVQQLAESQGQVKILQKTLEQLHNQMERTNDTFYKEREENLHLKDRLRGALTKEESEKISRQVDQYKLQVNDLNAAINTYRNLYDTAIMQTKTMKYTIEKINYDHNNLVNTIKDLQSISDQNMTIGKLYHHLMIARWHEAQTNQKNEKLLDELRKIKIQVESYDAMLLEKSEEIMQQNQIFSEQVRNYEIQITELKMKILPTVTLERVEEQAKRIKELSEMKNEAERMNRDLRLKFHELQLKADYFDAYKEKLDQLEVKLRAQNPDELSQQIIEVSQKYSDTKIELLKLQREVQIIKEKEEYYQRLNRQYTDTIKRLEFDLSHSDLQLRKREEDWRKKFYEQRKTIFAQLGLMEKADDVNGYAKKNIDTNQKMAEMIKEKQKQNNKIEKEEEREDPEIYKRKVQELQAELKRKDLEIDGYIQRQKIISGGSQMFGQQQVEEITKKIMVEEAEKVSQAGQQMLKAMQEMLNDKEAEIDRKEKQIEQLKKESMAHKKKDVEEIQRLNDLLHKYRNQPHQVQGVSGVDFNQQQQQQDPGQIVMIENYQRTLVEKDTKIKDLQLHLESERNSLKKLKVELQTTYVQRDTLERELEKERTLNNREQYIQKIETLQKVVNEKNKELQRVKQTVITLKEELFKISEETINKEQSFKTKESKLNSTSSELETKLVRMLNEIKQLKQELKDKQRKLEQIEEKEIQNRAVITDLEKRNQELRAIIQAGGGKLNEEEQTVANIRNKLNQVNQLTIENDQLKKELALQKNLSTDGLFDNQGNLICAKGLYFQSYEEFLARLKLYLSTKPKLNILKELRNYDKQGQLVIPLPKFFEVLSIMGIKLKSRDQKMVIDAVKQGELAQYYHKFYYPFMGWVDQSLQTEQQQSEQQNIPQMQQSQRFSLKKK